MNQKQNVLLITIAILIAAGAGTAAIKQNENLFNGPVDRLISRACWT